ncbi:UDP-glucose dehydrogenase family protein [Paenibacillus woosongensis]|uniref:UDP-glucose 6-dehydrogenase n=1 Tax=Paenibacillus woosongensis TaxID=307580 RepID=A0ABQ4MWB1_9BACL|nr:UDP-glucose/GDP-mannose dehydrogenase family protein [Paenibacillus woosongensis]GIP60220.1 UDP-glucose 6-dehydrogenase YwqF [Paenibacillus woosongensis]
MRISVIGTGYVGLVTGVCLAEIGHIVTCIDIDALKINLLRSGKSPIYEPGLEELIVKNMAEGRLHFTNQYNEGLIRAEVIYIAVGTPSNEDGTADLSALEDAAIAIADQISNDVVIVTKSTVPIGTGDRLKAIIEYNKSNDSVSFEMVSNPEFLREGSAINDTFYGDRIIIGSDSVKAAEMIEEINKPFQIPIYKTSIRSAEMIKYASNAFLATKISFINEISNLCEKLDADITEVAQGMGMDKRIGAHFLNAGIGYGGSCFPKDTNALMQIAGNANHDFELLRSVIEVNKKQQNILTEKAKRRFGSLEGLKIAVLGLAFKPNTDDMREAASLTVVTDLIKSGAVVSAYDPIAIDNARKLLPEEVEFLSNIEDAIQDADCVFILTEWPEIVNFDLELYVSKMGKPVIFDGRNCLDMTKIQELKIEYHSVGRSSIYLNHSYPVSPLPFQGNKK